MNKKAEGTTTENKDDIALEGEILLGAENEDKNLEGQPPEDESHDDESDEETVVVTIGEEAPPPEEQEHAEAPQWVKELRKTNRELARKNRELESKLKSTTTETKPVELAPKPKLEDHDYDTDKYEAALEQWHEQKRTHDAAKAKAVAEAEAAEQQWQTKLTTYGKSKAELKVKDFEDAEAVVQETLSVTQQGILMKGASNPAVLVYAIGKNPKKAKELAAITDPVEYAFAVAKLETQLKVTQRKAPPPEKVVSGSGGISGSGAVDSTLERLRAEAAKTGDYTKVTQYRMSKRQANK